MRISEGPVSNIDWLYEIRNARAFARGTEQVASVGDLSHVQLFNPAASGITIAVHLVIMSVSVAGPVNWVSYDAALTTLAGTGFNLDSGGAASVGEIRNEALVAAGGNAVFTAALLADTATDVLGEWFLLLGAGEGIVTRPGNTNIGNRTSFEWVEY